MGGFFKSVVALFAAIAVQGAAPADKVLLTIASTGDARLNPKPPNKNEWLNAKYLSPAQRRALGPQGGPGDSDPYPVTFNAVQLQRTLEDLGALDPNPDFFFFTGDLVMGFAKDKGEGLAGELAAFAKSYKSGAGSMKSEAILLPGNHETTYKVFPDGKPDSGVQSENKAVWLSFLKDLGLDKRSGNGPHKGEVQVAGSRSFTLQEDEENMTFSFSTGDGSVHFVVVNTDTLTSEGPKALGLFPISWVRKDLEAAQADPRIKHIFVVGHKPVFPPANFVNPGRTDAMDPLVAQPFRELLVANDKVRAYLCSHAHLYHADSLAPVAAVDPSRPRPAGEAAEMKRPVQILAGNGGCEFEKFWDPTYAEDQSWLPGEKKGPYFGFALVKVHESGKVTFVSYQRPAPEPFYADSQEKARPRKEETLIR